MDLGTALLSSVSVVTLGSGIIAVIRIFRGNGKSGTSNSGNNKVSHLKDVIEAKGFQTSEEVNKIVSNRLEEFLSHVCRPHWKRSQDVEKEMKEEMRLVREEQKSQGLILAKIDTSLVSLIKKLG